MTPLTRLVRALDGHNAYRVLGISASASAAEIKKAYRAKARVRHPDRSGAVDPAAMAVINVAYEVLRDCRADYDRHLAAAAADQHDMSGRRQDTNDGPRTDSRAEGPEARPRPASTQGAETGARSGDFASGLWDEPAASSRHTGERAGPEQTGQEQDAEPGPSLWDEPPPPARQHPRSSPPAAEWAGRGHYGNPYRYSPRGGHGPHSNYHGHHFNSSHASGYPPSRYMNTHWPQAYRWPNDPLIPPVHTFMWLAIITAVIIAPFGVFAIIKSAEAGSRNARGDLAGARKAARSSLTWSAVGFLSLFLFLLVLVAVAP